MFEKLSSTIRDANANLASASKAWRDESLTAREEKLTAREEEARRRERSIAEWHRNRKWKLVGNRLLMAGIAVVAFFGGLIVGDREPYPIKDSNKVSGSQAPAKSPNAGPGALLGSSWNVVSISVPAPADRTGKNTLIAWRNMPNGNRESISHRIGTSGESYGRRETDCASDTFRYLGEGDTLSSALEDSPSPSLTPLTPSSISTEVSTVACSQ